MDQVWGIRVDTLKGIGWMMGVLTSFLGMAVAGRQLVSEIGIFELLFLRGVICFVILAALLPRFGWASLVTRRPLSHLGRNTINFAGQWGWFYAIASIPLSAAFAIEFTIPVWTAILCAIFLGEALTRARVAAIVLGFIGVLIILRPGLETVHPAALAMLFSAFCFSSAYVFTRSLTRSDTTYGILVYMILMQLPMSGVFALSDWVWPEPHLWPWLLVVGVAALTSQLCLARAFKLAEVAIMVPFDFLRLPLGAVIGTLAYNDPLDPMVFVGAAIIFGGNFINIWAERGRH